MILRQREGGQVFLYKTLMGILAPIIAIALAFVVSGLIILIFITSYTLTDDSIKKLHSKQIPKTVLENLQALRGKDFTEKSEFEKKAKSLVNDLTKKIDDLLEESKISKDDIKKEIHERIEELKRSRDEVEKEFKKIKEENQESFDKAESFLKNTASEIKSAFSDFFSSENDEKKGETKKESGDSKWITFQ